MIAVIIVLAVLTAAPPILDGDPETQWSIDALAEAITGVALILCREQRQHDKDAKRFLPLILLPALALAGGGCAYPLSDRGSWGDVRAAVFMPILSPGPPGWPNVQADGAGEINPVIVPVDEAATAEVLAQALASDRAVVVVTGGIHVTVSGAAEAASPGDTTQPVTGPQTQGTMPINVTPGAGTTVGP